MQELMSPQIEYFSVQMQAANAVGDAMMAAQAHQVEALIRNPEGHILSSRNIIDEIERHYQIYTDSKCGVSSMFVVDYLTQKYPDLFPKSAVLYSNHLRDWANHVLFLVQSKEGTWYAGSPANFPDKKKKRKVNPTH